MTILWTIASVWAGLGIITFVFTIWLQPALFRGKSWLIETIATFIICLIIPPFEMCITYMTYSKEKQENNEI